NGDWIFARAYASAARRGDAATQKRVADAYVPYMEAKFDYFERESRALFGREIPQVLLVHANGVNADRFGELAAMMRRRGYAFVTLEEALKDPAYRSPAGGGLAAAGSSSCRTSPWFRISSSPRRASKESSGPLLAQLGRRFRQK